MAKPTCHFIARIVFYSSEHGGRITPPQSGFHPQIKLNSDMTSCIIDDLSVVPGIIFPFDVELALRVTLLFPDRYLSCVCKGLRFSLYEGSKQIGCGTVVEIC